MLTGIFVIDAWGDAIGVGATAPRYRTLGGVAKLNQAAGNGAYIVAAEFVSARLALLVGLPVPLGIARSSRDEARLVKQHSGRSRPGANHLIAFRNPSAD